MSLIYKQLFVAYSPIVTLGTAHKCHDYSDCSEWYDHFICSDCPDSPDCSDFSDCHDFPDYPDCLDCPDCLDYPNCFDWFDCIDCPDSPDHQCFPNFFLSCLKFLSGYLKFLLSCLKFPLSFHVHGIVSDHGTLSGQFKLLVVIVYEVVIVF